MKTFVLGLIGILTTLIFNVAFAVDDPVIERAALMPSGDTLPQGGVSVQTVDLVSVRVLAGALDWLQIGVDAGYAVWGFGGGAEVKARVLGLESFKAAIRLGYHYIAPFGEYDDPFHLADAGIALTIGTPRMALHLGGTVGKSLQDFGGATLLIGQAAFGAEVLKHWKVLAEAQPFFAVSAPDERKNGYLGTLVFVGGRYFGERLAIDFGLGLFHDSDDRPADEKDRVLADWSAVPFPWVAASWRFGPVKRKTFEQPGAEE